MQTRILINASTLRGLGSAAVGRSVISSLASESEFELVARVPAEWGDGNGYGLGAKLVVPVRGGILNKFYNDQVGSRLDVRKWGCRALFSLGDTSMVGCRVPHLLLVQQPHLAVHESDYDFDLPGSWRVRLRLMKANLRACLPSVDKVTVQTQAMKDSMCSVWDLDPDKIVVIPSSTVAVDQTGIGRSDAAKVDVPYIIYPAAPYPHKNHEVLPDVMVRLKDRHPELRCLLTVGAESVPAMVAEAQRLGVVDRFAFVGPKDMATTRELMANARAVIFPSKLESFGLPCYEALELGVPLVVADRPYSREACGDSALYCGPDDGDGFAQAVDAIMGDDAVAADMSARALDRATGAVVPWTTIAKQYGTELHQLVAD